MLALANEICGHGMDQPVMQDVSLNPRPEYACSSSLSSTVPVYDGTIV